MGFLFEVIQVLFKCGLRKISKNVIDVYKIRFVFLLYIQLWGFSFNKEKNVENGKMQFWGRYTCY